MLGAVARCRACDAPILWAVTSAGKKIPVDAAPNPKGNIVLHESIVSKTPIAIVTSEPSELRKWMPHHATCPNAAAFRKSAVRQAAAQKPRKKAR